MILKLLLTINALHLHGGNLHQGSSGVEKSELPSSAVDCWIFRYASKLIMNESSRRHTASYSTCSELQIGTRSIYGSSPSMILRLRGSLVCCGWVFVSFPSWCYCVAFLSQAVFPDSTQVEIQTGCKAVWMRKLEDIFCSCSCQGVLRLAFAV